MNAETLTALQLSIEHWERIANGDKEEGLGPRGCDLCQRFNPRIPNSLNHITTAWRTFKGGLQLQYCSGCPVMESGPGRNFCSNTPHEAVAVAEIKNGRDDPAFIAAAKAELDFLKSLLPKDA